MVRTVSPAGRAALMAREGCRLVAYLDSVGVPTIGVGHTGRMSGAPVHMGMTITQAQAGAYLAADLVPVETAIAAIIKVILTQHQVDALASLAFNIGVPGFTGSTVVHKLNAGDVQGAADAFLMWERPAALKARREAERTQFLTPDVPSVSSPGPVHVDNLPKPKKPGVIARLKAYLGFLGLAYFVALLAAPAMAGSPYTVDPSTAATPSPNAALWAWLAPYVDQVLGWALGLLLAWVALKARQWFGITMTATQEEQLRQTALTGAHLAISAAEGAADHANIVPDTVAWMKAREPAIIGRLGFSDQILAGIALKMATAALSGAPAQAALGGSAAVEGPAMERADGSAGER